MQMDYIQMYQTDKVYLPNILVERFMCILQLCFVPYFWHWQLKRVCSNLCMTSLKVRLQYIKNNHKCVLLFFDRVFPICHDGNAFVLFNSMMSNTATQSRKSQYINNLIVKNSIALIQSKYSIITLGRIQFPIDIFRWKWTIFVSEKYMLHAMLSFWKSSL